MCERIEWTINGTTWHLVGLSEAGLLTVRKQGNQKHYQANASAPVFTELHSLVLKTMGLADVLRVALVPLAAQISAPLKQCPTQPKGKEYAGVEFLETDRFRRNPTYSDGAGYMAQIEKVQPSRLIPSPKALQKALAQSAKQAQRMAVAFGLVVPSIKPKQTGTTRHSGLAAVLMPR